MGITSLEGNEHLYAFNCYQCKGLIQPKNFDERISKGTLKRVYVDGKNFTFHADCVKIYLKQHPNLMIVEKRKDLYKFVDKSHLWSLYCAKCGKKIDSETLHKEKRKQNIIEVKIDGKNSLYHAKCFRALMKRKIVE